MHDLPWVAPLGAAWFDHVVTTTQPHITSAVALDTATSAAATTMLAIYRRSCLARVATVRTTVDAWLADAPPSVPLAQALELFHRAHIVLGRPARTMSQWRERGLITTGSRHPLDHRELTVILMMALLLPTHQRNWLPPMISRDAPAWWCWQIQHPHAQPTPIAISAHLPDDGILITPWAGAAREASWQRLQNNSGAAYWAAPLQQLPLWASAYGLPHTATITDTLSTVATPLLTKLISDPPLNKP